MKILVLGGTGAIGVPLVNKLSLKHEVFVTSRSARKSENNINYIEGNAKDTLFLFDLLSQGFDIVIDLMVYNSNEFKERIDCILQNVGKYIFFSSARCFAETNQKINEFSPRLLDVSKDDVFLNTDDYALAKAREENLLFSSKQHNWTILRPYITFNTYRLQLGPYEKEMWLYRVLKGRTLIIPKDIYYSITTLTYALDLAECISRLIESDDTDRQVYNIVSSESHTWEKIFEMYSVVINKKLGKLPKYKLIDSSKDLEQLVDKYQIKYGRKYNRSFDNTKLLDEIGEYEFNPVYNSIVKCIDEFLINPKWLNISPKFEAWSVRISGEYTPLKEFDSLTDKIRYIKWRFLRKP